MKKKTNNVSLLISVIIATASRPDDFQECLNSLLTQEDKKFEIIVVDGSDNQFVTELCSQIVSTDIPIIHIEIDQKNLPYARNCGIEQARGEIIAFIDDDAWAPRHWVSSIRRHFEKYQDTLVAGGGGKAFFPGYIARFSETFFRIHEKVSQVDVVAGMNMAVHRIRWERARRTNHTQRNFWFDSDLKTAADDTEFCFFTRRILQGVIRFDPQLEVLHKYRNNLSTFILRQYDYAQGDIQAWQKYTDYFPENVYGSVVDTSLVKVGKGYVRKVLQETFGFCQAKGWKWFPVAFLREASYGWASIRALRTTMKAK